MTKALHTVCETHSFRRAAEDAGLPRQAVDDLIAYLAANPMAGVEISGTGGCRTFRLETVGGGKSREERTVAIYSGPMIPVFLVALFSGGERTDLDQKERQRLAAISRSLVATYSTRVIEGKIPS